MPGSWKMHGLGWLSTLLPDLDVRSIGETGSTKDRGIQHHTTAPQHIHSTSCLLQGLKMIDSIAVGRAYLNLLLLEGTEDKGLATVRP